MSNKSQSRRKVSFQEDDSTLLRFRLNRSLNDNQTMTPETAMNHEEEFPLRSVIIASSPGDSGIDSPNPYYYRPFPPNHNPKSFKNGNYINNGSYLSQNNNNNDSNSSAEEETEKRSFGLTGKATVSFLMMLVIMAASGFAVLTITSLKSNRNGKYDSLAFAHRRLQEKYPSVIVTDEEGLRLAGKRAAIQYHYDAKVSEGVSQDFENIMENIDKSVEGMEKVVDNMQDFIQNLEKIIQDPVLIKDDDEEEFRENARPQIDYDIKFDGMLDDEFDDLFDDYSGFDRKRFFKRSPPAENPLINFRHNDFRTSYYEEPFRFNGQSPFRKSRGERRGGGDPFRKQ